jgi:hypothetical protein
VREAIRALDVLDGEASELLRLHGEQPTDLIPQRGSEGLATDIKRRLDTATPPPVPRTAPATVRILDTPESWAA